MIPTPRLILPLLGTRVQAGIVCRGAGTSVSSVITLAIMWRIALSLRETGTTVLTVFTLSVPLLAMAHTQSDTHILASPTPPARPGLVKSVSAEIIDLLMAIMSAEPSDLAILMAVQAHTD